MPATEPVPPAVSAVSAEPRPPVPPVRTERSGPVTTVVLSRPEARNAVDGPTALALADAFRAFDADEDAAVAVLWGEGALPWLREAGEIVDTVGVRPADVAHRIAAAVG